jgi:hypothetical protein
MTNSFSKKPRIQPIHDVCLNTFDEPTSNEVGRSNDDCSWCNDTNVNDEWDWWFVDIDTKTNIAYTYCCSDGLLTMDELP